MIGADGVAVVGPAGVEVETVVPAAGDVVAGSVGMSALPKGCQLPPGVPSSPTGGPLPPPEEVCAVVGQAVVVKVSSEP